MSGVIRATWRSKFSERISDRGARRSSLPTQGYWTIRVTCTVRVVLPPVPVNIPVTVMVYVPVGVPAGVVALVPLPKHAARPIENRIAIAPVCANRIPLGSWRVVAEVHANTNAHSISNHSAITRQRDAPSARAAGAKGRTSGALPKGASAFVVVATLSTMGVCPPEARSTVAGCTVHVLDNAASAHVSATEPAKAPKESARSWNVTGVPAVTV
jgi:hypothetical protein